MQEREKSATERKAEINQFSLGVGGWINKLNFQVTQTVHSSLKALIRKKEQIASTAAHMYSDHSIYTNPLRR